MKNFEEIKKEIFKEVEEENSSKSFIVEPEKVTVSESEVSDLTDAVLDVVKVFGKTCLRTIKNSKNPFDDFMRICQAFENLSPNSARFNKLKDSLIRFKENHKVVGTVIGILSTIIRTVARFVISGIKMLFKIVGAVIVALANIGYKIVQGVRGMVEEQLYTNYIIRDN